MGSKQVGWLRIGSCRCLRLAAVAFCPSRAAATAGSRRRAVATSPRPLPPAGAPKTALAAPPQREEQPEES